MKAYKINQFIGSNLYGSILVESEENAKKAVELANKSQNNGISLVYAGEVEAEQKFRVWEMFNNDSKERLFDSMEEAQEFIDQINDGDIDVIHSTAAFDKIILVEK